jgi:AraC-like DNA-binding protein
MGSGTMSHTVTFHLRQTWLGAVIDAIQSAAGRVPFLDRLDAHTFIGAFSTSLPVAHSAAERFVLRSLLLEFAAESGAALHARVHHSNSDTRCAFVPAEHLEPFWKPRGVTPLDAFQAWADGFFARFDKVHPVPPATRAAHVIRERCQQSWDLVALSRCLNTTSSCLKRSFRSEYGLSIRSYQQLVRLVRALDRVRHEKVEAVSLDLGYRSRKNFAQAFKKVTGLTSTEFRELPREEAKRIVDAARIMLSSPRSTARMRLEWSSHTSLVSRAVAADRQRS